MIRNMVPFFDHEKTEVKIVEKKTDNVNSLWGSLMLFSEIAICTELKRTLEQSKF